MELKVELKPVIGRVGTPLGIQETHELLDRVFVNGVFTAYVMHGEGGRVFGFQPGIYEDLQRQIVAKVKAIRPDIDDSKWSGVSQKAMDEAQREESDDE